MHRIRLIILLVFTWSLTYTSEAAHIIGGVMTFECTAPGKYTISMKIYRDCQGGGAEFDSKGGNSIVGSVTVYQGANIYQPYSSIKLTAPRVEPIPPDQNPCLIVPPGVCVEEGVYTFDLDLPIVAETYTIVYQRCCRNGSITNIVNPGGVGATFFVQINQQSQLQCNSSPVFNDFPPIVICNNEDIYYDHRAFDSTPGVQLVYSLCPPFIGGGTRGLGADINAQSLPNGIAPDPDQPPPYEEVTFIQPNYAFDRPLGAFPALSIDPNTGIMTGLPSTTGQFVVGVCVQEFLNGVLLSEIRRDFQFNVADCERRVFATLEADETLADGTFVIRACGDRTLELSNESTNVNFIDEYDWRFEIPGQPGLFNTRDVTVTFPDTGVYNAVMILNPNSQIAKCRDTAFLEVGVFGAIESNFVFDYDTCEAGPVAFTQQAATQNGRIVSYEWDFDDGNTTDFPNPNYMYTQPGVFQATLTVQDNRGCEAQRSKPISYFPVPELVIAAPDRFVACNPATITFSNLSEPVNEEYFINWDFGDGQSAEGLSVSHVYEDPGVYSVGIEIISPIGCRTDGMYRNWISVKASPEAGFSYSPDKLNDLEREVFFSNTSQGSDGFQWSFGDGNIAFIENPVHEYADTGKYEVVLIAFSQNGCTDTAQALLDVEPINTYFLPNAFSPNDDGLNDEYMGTGILKGIRAFSMTIWNRWGEKVYESNNPTSGWNGQVASDGQPAPKGIYHCQVEYITARGERQEVESAITLLR